MALFAIMLAMGLALMASPAEAAPFAYVTNNQSDTVSVIDTATNAVVATVPVGSHPLGVAATPDGTHAYVANGDSNTVSVITETLLDNSFTTQTCVPSGVTNGIKPVTEPVTLKIGAFTTTIPPGSFKDIGQGIFVFRGVIGGVRLGALIAPTGANRYALVAAAQDANLTGATNPVPMSLTIGDDCGTASVQALIIP